MKASPLELHNLRFIEASISAIAPPKGKSWPRPFDFDGVNFIQNITVTPIKNDDAPPNAFSIRFKNAINNQGGVPTPYNVTLEAVGVFSVNPKYEGDTEEFVLVYGCGVIWSAMRDFLLSFTSRSLNGELILPPVSFHDITDQLVPTETKKGVKERKPKASRPEKKARSVTGSRTRPTAKTRTTSKM